MASGTGNLFAEPSADSSSAGGASWAPLAERMRPRQLDDYAGQEHLLGADSALRKSLESGHIHSMVLWGPPGTGKTTLARLIAGHVAARFQTLSAVTSGVKDIRSCIEQARQALSVGERTVLFVDEVHRFNKAQQDAFLPHIEDGTIVFVGATTENPSFELNRALLSRLRVYVLKQLEPDTLRQVVSACISDVERGLGSRKLDVPDEVVELICEASGGDARRAISLLEVAADLVADGGRIDADTVRQITGKRLASFDKGGDQFFDQISALHKSIRGSNPDAALYWTHRMLEGGCDPHYLLRRFVRIASEDIGNADPRALGITIDAWEAFDRLGSPEGDLAIGHAAVFLAVAAKSNAVYAAFKEARQDAEASGDAEVPMHIRNAPTGLLKEIGAGAGYRYDHDEKEAFSTGQTYFPDALGERVYYRPVDRGLEIRIGEKLDRLRGGSGDGRGPGKR